jgi:hypothetical protein
LPGAKKKQRICNDSIHSIRLERPALAHERHPATRVVVAVVVAVVVVVLRVRVRVVGVGGGRRDRLGAVVELSELEAAEAEQRALGTTLEHAQLLECIGTRAAVRTVTLWNTYHLTDFILRSGT